MDLNITKEELLDLAASKLADQYGEMSDIESRVHQRIEQRIAAYFSEHIKAKIDEFLNAEMGRIVNQTINPVDIWGDKTGAPTTIRAQLAERAKTFWEVKVGEDGRESAYGGEPRHTRLMKQISNEEFTKAIKANAEEIVGAFKVALTADASKLVAEHIDKLINVKRR